MESDSNPTMRARLDRSRGSARAAELPSGVTGRGAARARLAARLASIMGIALRARGTLPSLNPPDSMREDPLLPRHRFPTEITQWSIRTKAERYPTRTFVRAAKEIQAANRSEVGSLPKLKYMPALE